MATLETQYKNFKSGNPDSTFSFEEWKKWYGEIIVTAFEKFEEEQKWYGEIIANSFKKFEEEQKK